MVTGNVEARRDGRTTDTRKRIEATALTMFVTKGFGATSLKDIADELGITKAAVYYHFQAKADLAHSVFQPFIDDVDALLVRLEGSEPTQHAILTAYADALVPHRMALAAMLRDPGAVADLDLEGVSARWLRRIGALLQVGDTSSESSIRTAVAVGGLTRALMLPETEDPVVRRAAVDAAAAALGSPARMPRMR